MSLTEEKSMDEGTSTLPLLISRKHRCAVPAYGPLADRFREVFGSKDVMLRWVRPHWWAFKLRKGWKEETSMTLLTRELVGAIA